MAVFDKASLVMIPSQYKEGKIYNIKPEDQSSSFEFERGSAATRVNSSGLIERIVGDDFVLNKDFTQDWSTIGGWTLSNGFANFSTTGANGELIYDHQANANSSVQITFTVSNASLNGAKIRIKNEADTLQIEDFYDNGTHTVIFYVGTSASKIRILGVFDSDDFSLSNIQIRQLETDTPRLDYSGTEPALLLEPQRTNDVTYSEDFTQWSKNNVTLVGGYSAPDGTNTAYKVSGDSTSSLTFSLGLSGTETRTIWAKTVSGTGQLNLTSHNANTNNLFTITENWERFEVNGTTSTSGRAFFYAVDFRGSSTLTEVIIWGAQAEQGSYATSYIPTNGQAETRLADVCQGGGDASVFNDSEGVLYAEVSRLNGDLSATTIAINKGGSEFSGFSFRTDGKIWAATYNGTSYENISQYTPTDFYDTYKICYKYKSNDFALWVNGVEVDSSVVNTLTLTGLNNLSFSSGTATNKFLGNVRALHYFPEALTDTELQQLTTI